MKAKDIEAGDVLDDSNGYTMVRDTRTRASGVNLLLSAGRTDPGFWTDDIDPERELEIYRSPNKPLQHN